MSWFFIRLFAALTLLTMLPFQITLITPYAALQPGEYFGNGDVIYIRIANVVEIGVYVTHID
jgi:hypothetical protein